MEQNDLDFAIFKELESLENDASHPNNNNVISINNQNSQTEQTELIKQKDQYNITSYKFNENEYDEFIKSISNSKTQLKKAKLFSLLEKAYSFISNLNSELISLTESIKSIYNTKFPELPSIVTNPYNYIQTIQAIEEQNISNINQNINLSSKAFSFLPNNVYMALTFMLSSTKVNKMSRENEEKVHFLYKKILSLYHKKTELLTFVSKNMNVFAPNLTALLGPDIAGKLVTCAGGIAELGKIPSNNIMNMGNHVVNLEGFSSKNKLFNGYLTELSEYKEANDKMKIKVLRRYANKAALAARVDAFSNEREKEDIYNDIGNKDSDIPLDENEDKDEENFGRNMKDVIASKVDKIENNKQPILEKPLPRPDDKPRRKRGGKRTRSIKRRYEMTEIRMLKNRMKFGPEGEKEYRDTGEGFGMLQVGGVGSRIKTTFTQPLNNKIVTKKQKVNDMKYNSLQPLNNKFSGIHSSVVMSSVNGIELINPELLRSKLEDTKNKYFDSTSGFSTVVRNRLGEM